MQPGEGPVFLPRPLAGEGRGEGLRFVRASAPLTECESA